MLCWRLCGRRVSTDALGLGNAPGLRSGSPVTIDYLVDLVAEIAGVEIKKKYVAGPHVFVVQTRSAPSCARYSNEKRGFIHEKTNAGSHLQFD